MWNGINLIEREELEDERAAKILSSRQLRELVDCLIERLMVRYALSYAFEIDALPGFDKIVLRRILN
jgi:hypothetical protein